MRKRNMAKLIIVLAVCALTAFSTNVFAQRMGMHGGVGYNGQGSGYTGQQGSGYGMGYNQGYNGQGSGYGMGYGGMGYYGQGQYHHGLYGYPAYMGNLTEEQIQALNDERDAFFAATEDIRKKIYEKGIELSDELSKADTDVEKAAALQTELSDLRAQLDKKQLDHIIRMKGISPDFSQGFQGWNGHFGGGYGGHGNCWMWQ